MSVVSYGRVCKSERVTTKTTHKNLTCPKPIHMLRRPRGCKRDVAIGGTDLILKLAQQLHWEEEADEDMMMMMMLLRAVMRVRWAKSNCVVYGVGGGNACC